MTHDPLCPRSGYLCTGHESDGDILRCKACAKQAWEACQCSLIAKVRADQRDKAVQRVEQNVLVGMTLTPKEVCAVIAAVRGES